MSAFCVFGVSREDCRKKAERKVRVYDKELKRMLTPEEWKERVDALTEELFAQWHAPKQISPSFDAPQFARDWIEVAKRCAQIEQPKIMCRGEKVDPKGKLVLRKGKPVIGWTLYEA